MNTSVARDITRVAVMSNEACRIALGSNGGALAIETSLRAERSVLLETLAAIISVD